MDGTISKLRFAEKRVIPYHLRSQIKLPEPNTKISKANDQNKPFIYQS
jgi:hypothetical protein